MSFTIVIPARVDSTRFPGKMAVRVGGRSLLGHTVHAARRVRDDAGLPVPVYVATDNVLLADIAYDEGAIPVLTSSSPQNGTERIAEVVEKLGLRGVIVNLQGDSPLVQSHHILAAVKARNGLDRTIGTICFPSPVSERKDPDPGRVTAVLDGRNIARHFTRSKPTYLPPDGVEYLHCGVYAYTPSDLVAYRRTGVREWEQREGLEQLRWTWMGWNVACRIMEGESLPPEVNYPEDLDPVREALVKRVEPLYLTSEKHDG